MFFSSRKNHFWTKQIICGHFLRLWSWAGEIKKMRERESVDGCVGGWVSVCVRVYERERERDCMFVMISGVIEGFLNYV